jgi:nuclear pore complex protein Nup188
VVIRIDDIDKTAATAISDKFDIDQIQALILFRAFVYNEGLPSDALSDSNASFTEQLIDVITPFYLSERLYLLRTLTPLFRADANESDFAYEFAQAFLPSICPEKGRKFVKTVIAEYQTRSQAALPVHTNGDPRSGTLWAKQNAKEQLILLEVLFWAMWSRITCDGPLVMRIFETAYESKLGQVQRNSSYLLDQEGSQLQQDSAALWILITVEVLELETVAEVIDFAANSDGSSIYTADPESLKRIHELVTSHGDSQYACTYMAWAFVVSRLQSTADQLVDVPENYKSLFASFTQTARSSFAKDSLPLHVLMSRTGLEPEVGLLKFMLSMLTSSPLFVTSVALRTGSTITDPNNVAFRSVYKGAVSYYDYMCFL